MTLQRYHVNHTLTHGYPDTETVKADDGYYVLADDAETAIEENRKLLNIRDDTIIAQAAAIAAMSVLMGKMAERLDKLSGCDEIPCTQCVYANELDCPTGALIAEAQRLIEG